MSGAQASPVLHRSRVRVRYAETDCMGVVYYANYLVWFEIGRTGWFRALGESYRDMEAAGVQLPVIEAHCEYRRPAKYDDDLEIRTQATLLSPIRIRFDYEVVRGTDETLVTGHTVHAGVDPQGRPCRLPAHVRDILADTTPRETGAE
jgi:acyl-CoA thioester hydrolase